MYCDFSTEPEFQDKLDWMERFVREEVEPVDALWGDRVYERPMSPALRAVVTRLQHQVREQRLWACHLGPELGGAGYGQLKLALMDEILGRSAWAPTNFGCQAPDTGNAEIIAHFGAPEQLQAQYETEAGHSLESMTWFAALVRYKQAAASALICKNSRKSAHPSERGLAMAHLVPSLAGRAVELLSG